MSIKDLRAQYGKSRKSKALYNAAIREEIHGGDELLDQLELISSMRHRAQGESANVLKVAEEGLQRIRAAMVDGIKRDYQI